MTAPTKTACGVEADNLPGPCVLDEDHDGRHRDAEGYTWYDRGHKHGRPDVYEVTWTSGHVETVLAHQITFPSQGMVMFGGGLAAAVGTDDTSRVRMHAEIGGRWLLTLQAPEEDIRTLRLVTDPERVPGGEVR